MTREKLEKIQIRIEKVITKIEELRAELRSEENNRIKGKPIYQIISSFKKGTEEAKKENYELFIKFQEHIGEIEEGISEKKKELRKLLREQNKLYDKLINKESLKKWMVRKDRNERLLSVYS